MEEKEVFISLGMQQILIHCFDINTQYVLNVGTPRFYHIIPYNTPFFHYSENFSTNELDLYVGK